MADYLRNKKAAFDYALEDSYECGIELFGTEVKSVKHSHGSLIGAYVSVLGGELYLLGAHIPPWQEKNVSAEFDPYRSRKLLVTRKELATLSRAAQTKGLTIVPIALYGKGPLIKLKIAVAKGKKNFDKRETLKKKAVTRDIQRDLRHSL